MKHLLKTHLESAFGRLSKKSSYLIIGCVIALSGCTAGNNAILKTVKVGDNTEDVHIFTGARQRLITNHFPKLTTRPGLVDPQRIVCAEPSPDIAVNVANSLSAGLGVFGYGSGSISVDSAEGLAQLAERTVSIQLMQMLMYRTCEAYSNGAIPGTVYNSKMDRIFQAMVTLSVADTAGGNFGRSLAASSSKANSEASAITSGVPNLFKGVEDAIGSLASAEEAVQKAESELAKAKETPTNTEDIEKAQTERDEAVGKRDTLRSVLKSEVNTAAKSAASATAIAAGGITAKPDEKVAKVLEKIQANFLDQKPILSYVDACIVELSLGSDGENDTEIQNVLLKNLKAVAHYRNSQKLSEDDKNNKYPDILDGTDLAATARFMWNGRKSGLFEDCRTKLASMVELEAKQQVALKGYKAETERSALVVREKEANAKIVSVIESAIKACKELVDKIAEKCITNAMKLGETQTVGPKQSFTEFYNGIPGNGGIILPVVPYGEAETALTELKALRKKLNDQDAPKAAATFTEEMKKTAEAEKAKLLAALDVLIQTGEKDLSAPDKSSIKKLQTAHIDILVDIQKEESGTPLRKIHEDKFKTNQTHSLYEYKRLSSLRDQLKEPVSSIKTMIEKLKKPKAA